jgi:hypothetical protein
MPAVVEAAQRDRGEARRNDVISRLFRRLCVCVGVTFVHFFRSCLVEIVAQEFSLSRKFAR